MSKYEVKTKQTETDVMTFLKSVEHPQRKADGLVLLEMMREVSGVEPAMWGSSIVGFGSMHYKYESGQEGDCARMGFSPRKTNLSLYVLNSYLGEEPLLSKLGKHKTGVSCLYINKLADVDPSILKELIQKAWTMNPA